MKIPEDSRLVEHVGSRGGCPQDVKEQMKMMRLDEIGENYENLMAKAVSHTTHKTEEAREGQK